eukprot:TRINITY_DN3845_c1_g1_i1.p2 TRINITY_DN3845_c1_g1~~TRINITY_DN3845_c1_g1_i1.p2  ORF type:complete len:206 (+),score=59.27 TRINITY_DN3845_c1_g1_i1:240-857(+)
MAPRRAKAARKSKKSAKADVAENQNHVEEQLQQEAQMNEEVFNDENQDPVEEGMHIEQDNQNADDGEEEEENNEQEPAADENADQGQEAGSNKPKDRKRRVMRKSYDGFQSYIYKVLKEVCPDKGISSQAMLVMNSFVVDMLERISKEAQQLAAINKSKTITSREIESGVRFVLPGQLAQHAMNDGAKAVVIYSGNQGASSSHKK